jgi:EmrB/QacA subfamily drug resistance transporter
MSTTTTTTTTSDIQIDRRSWLALYLLCGGMLMIVLDATIVNVALPAIQDDLGFTQSSLAWVVNSYLIAFGGLLMLSGRLGDLIGRRTMFVAGLAAFTVASVLCGVAQDQTTLVVARFLQGAGGAMTSAVILGMIFTMFPDPRRQAKAIGVYAFVASAGGAVGLLAGGVLTEVLNWHWIFFINVPIGIAVAFGATQVIERDSGIGIRQGADVLGAVLITSSLMLSVYTIVEPAARLGWGASRTQVLGALAVALMVAFVVREHTAKTPLMPLRIFRSRNLSGANVIQVLSVAGMFGMFFMGSLYLERVLEYGPLQIGLAFLPVTVIMGTLSVRYSDRLAERFGPVRMLVSGLVLIFIALLYFTQAPVDGSYVQHVFPVMVLMGTGAGMAFPVLMNLAMSGASPEDAGLASGLVSATAQVGGAIGLAALATVATGRTEALMQTAGAAQAMTSGFHLAFWVAAGLVLAAIVAAAVIMKVDVQDVHGEAAELEPAYA